METEQIGKMYVPTEEHYSLEILSAESRPNRQLAPFLTTGEYWANFKVSNAYGPLPDRHYLSISFYLWRDDSALVEYDQASGLGRFRLVDLETPETGAIIKLPVLDEDDDAESETIPLIKHDSWVDPDSDDVAF